MKSILYMSYKWKFKTDFFSQHTLADIKSLKAFELKQYDIYKINGKSFEYCKQR